MESSDLKNFQNIVKFVEDLASEFGSKQHSLILYNRLLSKTKITHHVAIKKHLNAFSGFISKNSENILKKNSSKLVDTTIYYSDKVNIKLDEIFKLADKDSTEIIWKHLLVITMGLKPDTKAVDVLKKTLGEKSNETEFLTNIVSKIENSVNLNENSDPTSAMLGILSSGVMTDLISSMNSGINSGNLNMGKLFGALQGLMSNIQPPSGESMASASSSNTSVNSEEHIENNIENNEETEECSDGKCKIENLESEEENSKDEDNLD